MCDGHSRKRRATEDEERLRWTEETRGDALGRRRPKRWRQTEDLAELFRAEQDAYFAAVVSAEKYFSTASDGVFVVGPVGAAGPY